MIEMGFFPVIFCMAAGAFVSISGVVRIIQCMTGNTLFRRVFVAVVRMTAQAEQFFMFAFKRKVGFIMIKTDFFPGRFVVAAAAFFSQLAVVWVIGFVAAVTACRCLPIFFVGLMAGLTCNRCVFSLESKISLLVIKGLFIQRYNIGITSLVICMALFTLLFAGQYV